jgi:hypothetical protein
MKAPREAGTPQSAGPPSSATRPQFNAPSGPTPTDVPPERTSEERVIEQGWGSTLRLISLRLGSAVAHRLSVPLRSSRTTTAGRMSRAARWPGGGLVAVGLIYAKSRGWL